MASDDEITARLIVMDTGPLITLAAADRLDYLLYPGLPVYVPDAVAYEATEQESALGAAVILDWMQARTRNVHIVPTDVFFSFVHRVEVEGAVRRQRDLGETAAIEAICDALDLAPNERALLISEDDRVLRRALAPDTELFARTIAITTRDLLDGLEAAQRIQSADEVYRSAQDKGRTASRRRALALERHDAAVDAVRRVMGRGPRKSDRQKD